jgi:hypothetical protein
MQLTPRSVDPGRARPPIHPWACATFAPKVAADGCVEVDRLVLGAEAADVDEAALEEQVPFLAVDPSRGSRAADSLVRATSGLRACGGWARARPPKKTPLTGAPAFSSCLTLSGESDRVVIGQLEGATYGLASGLFLRLANVPTIADGLFGCRLPALELRLRCERRAWRGRSPADVVRASLSKRELR